MSDHGSQGGLINPGCELCEPLASLRLGSRSSFTVGVVVDD